MEELAKKRVLLAGNDVSLATSLQKELAQQGAVVSQAHCVTASDYEQLDTSAADLVVITQLYDPGTHDVFLSTADTPQKHAFLPVIVLLDLESDTIERVLSRGATDFIDVRESLSDIMEKICAIFSQNDFAVAKTAIDITPKKAVVTQNGIRVYVVEDDPLLRNLLVIKLEKSGFIAEFSENGAAIIERMKSFTPDVLILDLMLPGKNGLDILKELKANPDTKHIPIIVFSNRDSQTDRQRAKTLGAAAFYVKAMTDLAELVELIELHAKK